MDSQSDVKENMLFALTVAVWRHLRHNIGAFLVSLELEKIHSCVCAVDSARIGNILAEFAANVGTELSLTAQDFLMTRGNAEGPEPPLSAFHKKCEQKYRRLFPAAVVADLSQNPDFRARWGTAVFPTLTKACTRMINIPKQQVYSATC